MGGKAFSMPLESVRENIKVPEHLTPVPHTPSYFLGVMSLNGSTMPVIDLRVKLSLKPDPSTEPSVIIAQSGGQMVGLVVDSIDGVVDIPRHQIASKPEINGAIESFIEGVFNHHSELIVMIDIAKILNVAEQRKIADALMGQ